MSFKVKRTVFKLPDMSPTLLPNCDCKDRRVVLVGDDVYCGDCGVSYSLCGSINMIFTKITYIPVKDEW